MANTASFYSATLATRSNSLSYEKTIGLNSEPQVGDKIILHYSAYVEFVITGRYFDTFGNVFFRGSVQDASANGSSEATIQAQGFVSGNLLVF